MTKILPTRDDDEAEKITAFLENPEIPLDEKAALLEDPTVQEVAQRLDAEVRMDGSVPHKMEKWQEMLEHERNGPSTVHSSIPKPNTAGLMHPKQEPNTDGGIRGLFLQNEMDEGVSGAKVVPMEAVKKTLALGRAV